MNVTEQEANDRRCCIPNSGTCIASRCMAWRWAEPKPEAYSRYVVCEDTAATVEPDRPKHISADWSFEPADEDNACWREPEMATRARQEEWDRLRRGYCGLAGEVEH